MSAGVQLLNQYFLLWAPLALFGGGAVVMILRRGSCRWWLAWGAAASVAVATLLALRTPPGTISHFVQEEGSLPRPESEAAAAARTREVIDPKSVEDIETALVTPDGKPTLVEIYTDYGLA